MPAARTTSVLTAWVRAVAQREYGDSTASAEGLFGNGIICTRRA